MTLKEVKTQLDKLDELIFVLPDQSQVPTHFHVTEIGQINKKFIDCGGTLRDETKISFQLWTADDYDHRLQAEKLKSIISLAEKQLNLDDNLEVEVAYQGETINHFALDFSENRFLLQPTFTDCLAKDNCGIPESKSAKPKVKLADLQNACEPGSGCC
ncbi:MAG: DUF6428 family protein [Bacteroidota bacterium]